MPVRPIASWLALFLAASCQAPQREQPVGSTTNETEPWVAFRSAVERALPSLESARYDSVRIDSLALEARPLHVADGRRPEPSVPGTSLVGWRLSPHRDCRITLEVEDLRTGRTVKSACTSLTAGEDVDLMSGVWPVEGEDGAVGARFMMLGAREGDLVPWLDCPIVGEAFGAHGGAPDSFAIDQQFEVSGESQAPLGIWSWHGSYSALTAMQRLWPDRFMAFYPAPEVEQSPVRAWPKPAFVLCLRVTPGPTRGSDRSR